MLSNDVKTIPRCFATPKSTPKASEHILGPFEKKILIEFWTIRSHFLRIGLIEPLKMPIYEGFQNLKAFLDENYRLDMIGEACLDHNATFCRADFV